MQLSGKTAAAILRAVWECAVLFLIVLPQTTAAEPSVRNPNIALNKPATQSSTQSDTTGSLDLYMASNSVDGDLNSDSSAGSCSRTNIYDAWHWWTVDLGDVYTIQSIRITNSGNDRTTQSSWLGDFSVEVSVSDPTSLPGFPDATAEPDIDVCMTQSDPVPPAFPTTYACDVPVTGRYVRVVKHNLLQTPLMICEFEAYDYIAIDMSTTSILPALNNLALKKPATQNGGQKPASLAVDGNMSGRSRDCSATFRTDSEHWMTVDLEDFYFVESIRVLNRLACCQNRLRNFTVEVSVEDPLLGLYGFRSRADSRVCHRQIDQVPYDSAVTYACDQPLLGRYVSVVKSGTTFLSLCELEVFGRPSKRVWRFVYVAASQYSTGNVRSSITLHAGFRCARSRMALTSLADEELLPFVYIDLEDGACHFFKTFDESQAGPSSRWLVYRLE